jgi:hypothetical protein
MREKLATYYSNNNLVYCTEKLLEAARHGHLDNMRGVSANVMTGQFGYFGTGAFNLLLDLQRVERNNTNVEEVNYRNYKDSGNDTIHKKNKKTKILIVQKTQLSLTITYQRLTKFRNKYAKMIIMIWVSKPTCEDFHIRLNILSNAYVV